MTSKNTFNKKTNLSFDAFNSVERVLSSTDFHQLEFVCDFKGLSYVNDAKSIRPTATRYSLEAIETSVILIMGGDDFDTDYSVLEKQIKQKVVSIIYLGNNSDKLLKSGVVNKEQLYCVASIYEAVQLATDLGQSGDVVLFSPACTMAQENFNKRGNEFKQIVKNLSA